jgi:DNA adenine methylase
MPATQGASPFLKWAGGKQALVDVLTAAFPASCGRYFEPFVGGGSIALTLARPHTVICDQNAWLIDTYLAVRDDWRRVAERLDGMVNTKQEFLRIRGLSPETLPPHERAAHLIYLNKTCFRGLFRVNRKGQFNVPYGAYDRRYYDPVNLEAVARVLNTFEIRHGDFELGLAGVERGDFVYLDPPYYKLGGYSDFNRYTPGQFRESDQVRLAAVCRALDDRGVQWAVSNSDTALVRELFSGFPMLEISARREINLKSASRDVCELLIKNYEPQATPEPRSSRRGEQDTQPALRW